MPNLISHKEYIAACKLASAYLQQVALIAELRHVHILVGKQAKYFNQIVYIEKVENDMITISFTGADSEYQTATVHIIELKPL